MTPSQRGSRDAQEVYDHVWRRISPAVDYPVDMNALCHELGVDCFAAELSDDAAGALVKSVGSDARIILNIRDSVVRQRFTAAHELGHYMDRWDLPDEEFEWVDRRDALATLGEDPTEIYCNSFAASLLMPETHVRAEWLTTKNVTTLAYKFGVSTEAMTFRLRNLGLM